jgi:hypothetical protein
MTQDIMTEIQRGNEIICDHSKIRFSKIHVFNFTIMIRLGEKLICIGCMNYSFNFLKY